MQMQDNRNDDEIEIDLLEIFMLLLRRWWMIFLSVILFGVIGFLWSTFVLPEKYESTTEIYILNTTNSDNVTYSDLQMGSQLTKDYAHLITTRDVLEQVITELGLDESYGSLVDRISVQTPSDTRIVAITVTDRNPAMAQVIADKVREVASIHITNVMAIDAVNVASVANYPLAPSSPSVPKWTLLSALIGALFCSAIILIKYLLDDSIKTADDVEKYLNLSTLGMIPVNNEEEAKKESKKHRHSRGFDEIKTPEAEEELEEINLSVTEHGTGKEYT